MTQTYERTGRSAANQLTAAAFAVVAGASAVALAVYQVATPGSPTASYDSVSDWLREGLTLAYLTSSVVAIVTAARGGVASRAAAALVACGYGLIAAGVACGMVLQDDPDWFFVLAGPGLLASTAGFVWLAVSGFRARLFPAWAAALAGIGGVTALLLAELGTSVLVGSFWLWWGTQRLAQPTPTRSSQTKS